jgi:hypothetical protein
MARVRAHARRPCAHRPPCSIPRGPKVWAAQGKRGVWLKVPLAKAQLVGPAAADAPGGRFQFHHAEADYVMMTRWLPQDAQSTLPPNASHQVGTGGPRMRPGPLHPSPPRESVAEPPHKALGGRGKLPARHPSPAPRAPPPPPPRPQVGVGAFVVNARNEVLVVQEAMGPLKGKKVRWEAPPNGWLGGGRGARGEGQHGGWLGGEYAGAGGRPGSKALGPPSGEGGGCASGAP